MAHVYKNHLPGEGGRTYCGKPVYTGLMRGQIRSSVEEVNCHQCLRRRSSLKQRVA